jgi:hypothetical protein
LTFLFDKKSLKALAFDTIRVKFPKKNRPPYSDYNRTYSIIIKYEESQEEGIFRV